MSTSCRVIIPMIACLAVVAGACTAPGNEPALPDDSLEDFDEWDVLPHLIDRAYAGENFVHVNATPYGSALSEDKINVFVSLEGWWHFLHAEPDSEGHGVDLPVGTLIVREVLDATGAVKTLTVMMRAPDGYSPGHGDFWYAVLDPEGFPVFEDGEPLMGALVERCTSCHDERAGDGYLFGVPLVSRDTILPIPDGLQTPGVASF